VTTEWDLHRCCESMFPDCERRGGGGMLGGGRDGCRGSRGRFSCNPVVTFVSCDFQLQ